MDPRLRDRIDRLDWQTLGRELDERGHARAPGLLTARECDRLVSLYADDRRFRKRVDMSRLRFGEGDYAYFRDPLPAIVRDLRVGLYARLVPVANRWLAALGHARPFPGTFAAFRAFCRRAGQSKPTPLLLRYEADGTNRLHQDLYGDVVFPLQATILLSRRGIDYDGGEFVLVESEPRTQSLAEAIGGEQGELIVFPARDRPVRGRRGFRRARVRHGMSRVRRGSRYALGIIFHDAR